jgi:hypothetical protein
VPPTQLAGETNSRALNKEAIPRDLVYNGCNSEITKKIKSGQWRKTLMWFWRQRSKKALHNRRKTEPTWITEQMQSFGLSVDHLKVKSYFFLNKSLQFWDPAQYCTLSLAWVIDQPSSRIGDSQQKLQSLRERLPSLIFLSLWACSPICSNS